GVAAVAAGQVQHGAAGGHAQRLGDEGGLPLRLTRRQVGQGAQVVVVEDFLEPLLGAALLARAQRRVAGRRRRSGSGGGGGGRGRRRRRNGGDGGRRRRRGRRHRADHLLALRLPGIRPGAGRGGLGGRRRHGHGARQRRDRRRGIGFLARRRLLAEGARIGVRLLRLRLHQRHLVVGGLQVVVDQLVLEVGQLLGLVARQVQRGRH